MADNFVGEIRAFGFNFAPTGWALCAGQLLPISQNTALFSLLGVHYGGNGTTTFGLPNLQGAVAVAVGSNVLLGQVGGEAAVTVLTSQIPSHTHAVTADNNFRDASAADPTGTELSNTAPLLAFSAQAPTPASLVAMSSQMIAPAGGNVAHNNMMPYQVLTYCIALQGIFPPRS